MKARSLYSTAGKGRLTTRGRLGTLAIGITCLLGVLLVSAPSYGTQGVSRRNTRFEQGSSVHQVLPGHPRVRVTAAKVAAVKEHYVIKYSPSKEKRIVYVLDGTASPLNYSRIIVRTPQGDTKLDAFLKKNFPRTDLRGLNAKQVTLAIRERTGPAAGAQLKAAGNQSGYVCSFGICSCSGKADCDKMIAKCGVFVCWDDYCVCSEA